MWSYITACLLISVMIESLKGDLEVRDNGVYLKAYTTSGKFEFGKYEYEMAGNSSGNMTNSTETTESPMTTATPQVQKVVTVQLSSIMEMDSNNDPVTNHSIESFADLNFTMDSSMTEEMYFNLSAKKLSLETNLMGSAKLMLHLYVMNLDGEISLGDETHKVHNGQLRFTMHLSGWMWCTNGSDGCTQNGSAIVVAFTAQGADPAQKLSTTTGPDIYKLGNGQNITLSKKIHLDSTNWTSMANNYPMLETPNTFKVQFDKFMTQAGYDSAIDVSLHDDDEDNGNEITGSGTNQKSSAMLLLLAVAVVVCFKSI